MKMTNILFEVDMQNDFIRKNGALPVPNAEDIIPNCVCIKNHSIDKHIPRIGSVDRHFSDDHELKIFNPHCMNETNGQKIIAELYDKNTVFVSDKVGNMGRYTKYTYGELIDLMKQAQDGVLIFEKQFTDVFTNPNVGFVLEKIGVSDAYIFGVSTEYCVKDAAMGFIKRGIRTYIIVDAIAGISKKDSIDALNEMQNAGVKLIKTSDFLMVD